MWTVASKLSLFCVWWWEYPNIYCKLGVHSENFEVGRKWGIELKRVRNKAKWIKV